MLETEDHLGFRDEVFQTIKMRTIERRLFPKCHLKTEIELETRPSDYKTKVFPFCYSVLPHHHQSGNRAGTFQRWTLHTFCMSQDIC